MVWSGDPITPEEEEPLYVISFIGNLQVALLIHLWCGGIAGFVQEDLCVCIDAMCTWRNHNKH